MLISIPRPAVRILIHYDSDIEAHLEAILDEVRRAATAAHSGSGVLLVVIVTEMAVRATPPEVSFFGISYDATPCFMRAITNAWERFNVIA